MNKQDIYKIIGYNGNYDNKVKKAIRKLLKENHPDSGGNIENFKIINEVKKELEENKVSIIVNKKNISNNFKDIDYQYCIDKKKQLENKKELLQKELNEIKDNLKLNIDNYAILYKSSLDKEHMLYNNIDNLNRLMMIICVLTTLLIITLGIMIIFNKNVFIILSILLVMLVIWVIAFLKKIKSINNEKKIKLDDYFDTVNEIKISKKIKKDLNNKKLDLERKINKINNDIRFYDNIIKNE